MSAPRPAFLARSRRLRLLYLALAILPLTAGASRFDTSATAASTGLVAAYSFDQGSGSTLSDLSGNGNNGTIANASWSSAGKYGGALSFNGSSSRVTVPDSSSLDLTSGMTLEAWVDPNALGTGWRTAVLKEDSSASELVYALYANTDTTQPASNVFVGSDTYTPGGSLPLNSWNFLASTYDGTTLRLYVNGSQVASKTIGGAIAISSGPLDIGGNGVWGEWFQGLIDNVRVYNQPLSQSQVQADMNTAVGSLIDTTPPSTPTGLTTSATQTSITAIWTPSTDNVGVAGYDTYLNGTKIGTTASTSSTFSNRPCGTTFTVAVDSFDATGNRSPQASTSAKTAPCPTGLVAAYSFDQGSGSTLTDASGNGNNGTIANASWSSAGKYGGALSFNGSSSRVTVPDSSSLDLTSGMTLEAWVNPAALGTGWRTAVLKENSNASELVYALYANTDTIQPASNVFVGSDTYVPGGSLPVNGWSFIASIYDGTTLRLYVNGNQVASKTVGGNIATSSGPLDIGGNGVWGEWFQGLIDNIRVYNQPLSQSQIQADMNTAVGAGSGGGGSGDTTPPSAPTGLTTSATQTSITAGWTASTDNVGVAGYDVFLNGAKVATTTATSYTYSGLACATTYTVAVDAYDGAGNRSAPTSKSATTSACSTSTSTVYVSPNGSDSNPCTATAPCATFNRGYHAAVAGGTVQVAGGSYPLQTILADASKSGGPDVTIQAASGATVKVTDRIQFGSGEGAGDAPSHIVLRNITAPKKRIQVTDPAQNITLDHAQAGSFYVDGAQHVTIKGGDYGNCGSQDPQCEGGGAGSQNWIKDDISSSRTQFVTVDGAAIHDYNIQAAGDHYECLFLLGGTNITIQNSHFWNCEIYDIFIQANGPFAISGVTLQNNWFGRTQQQDNSLRGSAVVIGQHDTSSALSNVLVRYNSFAPMEALVDEGFAYGNYTNVRAIGNIFGVNANDTTNPTGGGGFTNCVPSVTYDYNVWRSGSCGSHSANLGGGAMPYVNTSDTAAGDYHLTGPTTVADNYVTPTTSDYALATDIDGETRTAPRTAGSDERTTTANPPSDTTPPSAPSGLATSSATQSSVVLSWVPSSDNIGVAGYDVYVNGGKVGTTSSTSFTFTGLACGTTYTLAVDAFDAAGNVSPQASITASTAACSSPPTGSASVFVATSGSDSNACTQAAPCASFNRAFHAALPGQIVQIAGGTYPAQEIDQDPSKASSSDVVLQPAPGTTVTVNGMLALGNGLGTPAASHLTIQGIAATQEIQAFTPASDVTWINMKARNFYFRGVQNMTVKGGIFGPCTSSVDPCENNKIDLASPPEQANANITIDGATFHDFRIGNPSDHFECMFLFGGTNITVENSKFYNCEFYDIFVQFAGEAFNGLKIQNNWFDTPWNGQNVQNRTTAIGFSPRGNPFTDVLVRYNSFRGDTGVSWNDDGCCVSYSNFRVVGNLIGLTNGCNNSVSFSFNIFVDGTCGSTDRTLAALPYVNGAHGPNWDWHLSGGLPVDFVPGTTTDQQLSFDQDGGTRPLGAGYDAGADELR